MSWLPSISMPISGWSRSNAAPSRLTVAAGSGTSSSTSRHLAACADDDGDADDEEATPMDPDAPPMFPALDSAQRSAPPPPPPTFALAPPSPTAPSTSRHTEAGSSASMAPPPSTTTRPAFGIKPGGDDAGALASASGARPPPAPAAPKAKKSKKVALAPGCSALDWARLCASGDNLRGVQGGFMRVTVDDLAEHDTPDDAWSAFNGRVYNMTEYMRFHPGGTKELMRVAGRDGTKLFMLTHSWVNIEHLLGPCLVGMLPIYRSIRLLFRLFATPTTKTAHSRADAMTAQADECVLFALTQYECSPAGGRVTCWPFDRIFRQCAGGPAIEVTNHVSKVEGKPVVNPAFLARPPKGKTWADVR
ncbi:hypothetical protein Q5752_004491 [Cryptotrichosporon argae]